MQLSTILDQIDLGAIALPEFQRGYVWNRDQVRSLMHSLYHKHPVGGLLVWVTKTETASARGDGQLAAGSVELLLDGQQRITSLYGIVRGKPPNFFDGNEKAFTDLHFNLDEETFEFYAPSKMKGNPLWIDVTDLMRTGTGVFLERLMSNESLKPKITDYIGRITAVENIKNLEFHIDRVTGEDKTVDVVVDIFNRVNSGGTKLSKGDLTLAKICAEWPDARDEMKKRLAKWRSAGFKFKLDWYLRNINTVLTGEALFIAMKDVSIDSFKHGLDEAETFVDKLLNLIASRLGLDHDRVLGSRGSFPLMARYIFQRGGQFESQAERDRLLYWYVHTFLWGRYSGSTESYLNRDLEFIVDVSPDAYEEGLNKLIEGLRLQRGDLRLTEADFGGNTRGSRFYPLLYMMSCVCHARDFGSGDALTNHLLGSLSSLQVHHIFPKALLKEQGYKRGEINAIANFTFLTQETNLEVSRRDPGEYIPHYEEKMPGAVASHWIPMDPKLWKVENYLEFLAERRKLLADAANKFLDKLVAGDVPETETEINILDREVPAIPGRVEDEEEERVLRDGNTWLVGQDLPEGEFMYEHVHPDTNEVMAIFDLAWPEGLQPGLSQPVCVLLDEGPEIEEIANNAGYRFFTSIDTLKEYVELEIVGLHGD